MTVDDENSIYVGGIPYDTTEEILRNHFDSYGHIVAVKIVSDRGIGGKCYGFVTFTNPRSALDAINDMNGTKMDGRVIRVNEVKTRGGRTNFNRDADRHSTDRGSFWDRSRNQERPNDNDKERYQDREDNHYHYRERERSRDRDQGKESGHEPMHDHDRTRDHFLDKKQERNRTGFDKEHNIDHDQNSKRGQDAERGRDLGKRRNADHGKISDEHKDQQSSKRSGSSFSGPDSRGYSSPSSGGHPDQVKKQLESSISRREDLRNEVSHWEVNVQDQEQRVSELQKQSQKLEDTLITARKLRQQRQMQLMKLLKCFMQVKDLTGRLKSSEQEIQELCDSATMEVDFNSDGVVKNEL